MTIWKVSGRQPLRSALGDPPIAVARGERKLRDGLHPRGPSMKTRLRGFTFRNSLVSVVVFVAILVSYGCSNRVVYGFCANCASPWGDGGERPQFDVEIVNLDFVPVERDDYKLHWMRETLTYAGASHFRPIIELKTPTPVSFAREFDIVRSSYFFADPIVGRFRASFQRGSTTPSKVEYFASLSALGVVPAGTPHVIYGQFWMGCTKSRRIRANVGRAGRSGDIYIMPKYLHTPQGDGVTVGGFDISESHHVTCTRIKRSKTASNPIG